MKLSVVTTLFKSAPYIEEFHRRISSEVKKITGDYEIIMVDDGSPDESLAIALKLVELDPKLRVIELSRNFGHHKAMMTGLENAGGEHVFLIDVDLEEPPELLNQFFDELQQRQYDVVYGYQQERKGGWFERVSGAIAWRLMNLMLPIRVPRNHSTVRLMTKTYTSALVSHKERKTAIGGLWVITGFRQHGIEFAKGTRRTKSYTLAGRFGMLLESITSFSETPLYGVFFLGLFILACSTLIAVYLTIVRIMGTVLEGWVSVMVSVWMLGGLGIFCIGVVGLYVSRIFIETKARPYTIVRNVHRQLHHSTVNQKTA